MGYLPDAFDPHFARRPLRRHEVAATRSRTSRSAPRVRSASPADGIDERFVVCNGDVLTDLDLDAMVRFHDERGARSDDLASPRSTIRRRSVSCRPRRRRGDRVRREARRRAWRRPTGSTPAPTCSSRRSSIAIPPRLTVSIERETFPRMLAEPGRLYAMRSDAYWLDIGTPEKYLQAHADVLSGCARRPPAPGAREVDAGVWVQGERDIDADARIEAPALIGRRRRCIVTAPGSSGRCSAPGRRRAGRELERRCCTTSARVRTTPRRSTRSSATTREPRGWRDRVATTRSWAGITVAAGTRTSRARFAGLNRSAPKRRADACR